MTETTTTPAPIAHTSRRNLLIAAPAVAPDNAFQRAVDAYHASVQRQKLAGEAHTMYETAEDGLGEPRRMIRASFVFAGQTIERDHELRPWDCDHPAVDIKDHPDFLAYCQEVREWQKRRSEWCIAHDGPAIEKEWEDACDDHCEAWLALATAPAPSFAALTEKLALGRQDDARDCDGYTESLIVSVEEDLKRLLGDA